MSIYLPTSPASPLTLKVEEIKENDECWTKGDLWKMYDERQRAIETGEPYQTRLNPAPVDPQVTNGG